MDIEEYINILERVPKDKVLPIGFGNPNSWRGSYSELVLYPVKNITIGEMIEHAESAVNETYCGYKGGEFKMNYYSEVNFELYEDQYDTGALLKVMLGLFNLSKHNG